MQAYVTTETDPEIAAREAEQREQRETRDRFRQKLAARGVEQPAEPPPTPEEIGDLDKRFVEAEAKHAELTGVADKAKAKAKKARAAFEESPDESEAGLKAAALVMVLERKALNAAMAVDLFDGNVMGGLRRAKQEQLDGIEREDLRQALHYSHIQAELDRIQGAAEALAEAVDRALPEIVRLLTLRRAKAARAIGLGLPVPALSLEQLISEIATRLTAKLHDQRGINAHQSMVQLSIVDTASAEPALRVAMNRPAAGVKSLL